MSKLIKIEIIRFFHSMEIIKYAFILVVLICFSSAVDFLNLESGQLTSEVIWETISGTYLYFAIAIIAIIGIYVGREFSQKTIYYEVMSGYSPLQICTSKIVTSGIFVSMIQAVAMMIYFITFSVTLNGNFWIKFFFLWLIILHFSCCTTLYIMIMKSGIIGGCVAFVRFVFLEVAVMPVLSMMPANMSKTVASFITSQQWMVIANNAIDSTYIFGIVVGIALEFLVLLIIVEKRMNKTDFQ